MIFDIIKKNICCCLFSNEYKEDNEINDMKKSLIKNDSVIEIRKSVLSKSIINLIKNEDYNGLSKLNFNDINNALIELSSKNLEELNIKEEFTINYYNNIKTEDQINIKRLITIQLFFSKNITNEMIIFINNKIWLFDSIIWLELILDSKLDNDMDKINNTIKLNKLKILDIFKLINYANCNYSMFEFIILGKLDNVNSHLKHIRFFNKESIIKLIDQSNACINNNISLLNILNELKKKDNIDTEYLDIVIKKLTKRFYFIN